MSGFYDALELRPQCWWSEDFGYDQDVQDDLDHCLTVIQGLSEPAEAAELFEKDFEDNEQSSRLLATLFVLLPAAVETLMAHAFNQEQLRRERIANRRTGPPQPRHHEKIGRNDPCPCGSGKKYKKVLPQIAQILNA